MSLSVLEAEARQPGRDRERESSRLEEPCLAQLVGTSGQESHFARTYLTPGDMSNQDITWAHTGRVGPSASTPIGCGVSRVDAL